MANAKAKQGNTLLSDWKHTATTTIEQDNTLLTNRSWQKTQHKGTVERATALSRPTHCSESHTLETGWQIKTATA
jgi:hypothetical protein